ncbi:MAG: inorganic diphosphatase, partial [Mangrovimonas sp.]|nr:inorganic diphosphatase [Mangrovimonas sp.]
VSNPIWNNLNNLDDINLNQRKEIEHLFQVYKDLEKKKVDVGGFGDAAEAYDILKLCIERYESSEHKATGNFTI